MTKLAQDKPLVRATEATHKGKQLVIKAYPRYVEIHPVGCRESYTMSWEAIYSRAAVNAARNQTE